MCVSTKIEEPKSKLMNPKHRMNRSTRPIKQEIKINLNIPELKSMIQNLKKFSYSVGCFNSYTKALMRILDNNMFGFNICLQPENQVNSNKVKVSFKKDKETSSLNTARSTYLKKVRNSQLDMVNQIFREINKKIEKMEAYMIKEIPELKQIFQQTQLLLGENNNRRAARMQREEPNYFPRLFEYTISSKIEKASQFKNMGFSHIVTMRYTYCSELIFFLNSDNTIIIYDLFQKKICQEINQWPFRIKDLIFRRNLNFYNSTSLLKVEFSKYEQFVDRNESSQTNLEGVNQNDFQSLAFTSLSIKDYFIHFADEIWFHKRGKRDKFILVFQFEKKNQLFFFYFIYKYKKFELKDRNESIRNSKSSMMNLSRSISLHKQKTSKFNKFFKKSSDSK